MNNIFKSISTLGVALAFVAAPAVAQNVANVNAQGTGSDVDIMQVGGNVADVDILDLTGPADGSGAFIVDIDQTNTGGDKNEAYVEGYEKAGGAGNFDSRFMITQIGSGNFADSYIGKDNEDVTQYQPRHSLADPDR